MKSVSTIAFAFLLTFCSAAIYGQQKSVILESKRNEDQTVDIFYQKNDPGSFTLSLEFTTLSNAFRPRKIYVAKANSGKLLTLKPINNNAGIGYGYSYTYVSGELLPKVDSSFVYLLPFAEGAQVTAYLNSNVGSSYFGSAEPKNWTAYSFIGETDTVFAARKAIVTKVQTGFDLDLEKVFTTASNQVHVEHADGTMARYSGFAKDGIMVEVGEVIYPQTPIGRLVEGEKQGHLSFMLFFLAEADFHNNHKASLTTRKRVNQYLKPHFLTKSGVETLVKQEKYIVPNGAAYFDVELSKREKKKRKKGK